MFFALLDKEFTLSDLCRLWESVFNKKFDRRNFQKHWTTFSLITNIIQPVAKSSEDKKLPRAPKYYKYSESSYKEFIKKNKVRF